MKKLQAEKHNKAIGSKRSSKTTESDRRARKRKEWGKLVKKNSANNCKVNINGFDTMMVMICDDMRMYHCVPLFWLICSHNSVVAIFTVSFYLLYLLSLRIYGLLFFYFQL